MLYLHGTDDLLVDYEDAPITRDFYRDRWSLDDEAQVSADAQHTWTRYTNDQGTHFEFLSHDYVGSPLIGGHCFPGSADVDGGAPGQLFGFACYDDAAFHWGEAVLRFFEAHPRD